MSNKHAARRQSMKRPTDVCIPPAAPPLTRPDETLSDAIHRMSAKYPGRLMRFCPPPPEKEPTYCTEINCSLREQPDDSPGTALVETQACFPQLDKGTVVLTSWTPDSPDDQILGETESDPEFTGMVELARQSPAPTADYEFKFEDLASGQSCTAQITVHW